MAPARPTDIDWRPFGWSTPQLLLAGLLIVICCLLLVVAATSTAGFNPYNANWDGHGEFRELADSRGEVIVGTHIEQYEQVDPNTTTGFVVAPTREYNTTAAATVKRFVNSGGTLVIADNYGSNGNALLSDIGATARFNGTILRDERHHFRSPALPVATNMSRHRLVTGVDSLTLNYGTAIDLGEATPIANSSEFGYLVQNESDTVDDSSGLAQYPVVSVESLGEGTVVLIGDPSLFINSMIEKTDNRQFATTLVGQRTHVLLDHTHASTLPPFVSATLLLRSSPLLASGVLSALLGLIVLVGRRPARFTRLLSGQLGAHIRSTVDPTVSNRHSALAIETDSLKADRSALRATLRERHPDWDDDRLDRVIAEVLSEQTDTQTNE